MEPSGLGARVLHRWSYQRPRQRVVDVLRGILDEGRVDDREALAIYAVCYSRSYLKTRCIHWQFGFHDSVAEVAATAAHSCVADLLRIGPGDGATNPEAPALRRGLRSVLHVSKSQALPDEQILLGFHRLLRSLSHQYLQRVWRQEHPQEARLLRTLKDRIRRTAHLRLVRDARGQFVCTRHADLQRPPVSKMELRQQCRDTRLLLNLEGFETALVDMLDPGRGHGGYCYLMDLVHIVHAGRVSLHVEMGQRWSEAALICARDVACDGIPCDLIRSRWLEGVKKRMQQIALRQTRKMHQRLQRFSTAERSNAVLLDEDRRSIRVEAGTEMVARKMGWGRAEWAGLSQREILTRLLPPDVSSASLQCISNQTDYLVRCIISELRDTRYSIWEYSIRGQESGLREGSPARTGDQGASDSGGVA